MEAQIIATPPKLLAGKKLTMSYVNNRTAELWRSFMPLRHTIDIGTDQLLYSVQVYPDNFNFYNFDVHIDFEKWAAMEVTDSDQLPEGMTALLIPEGKYAVWNYKGSSSDPSIFQYIFGSWFPASIYVPDLRPHFEVLGEKYKNNSEDSEEEIWIPIREK